MRRCFVTADWRSPASHYGAQDPLPSWNDGPAKTGDHRVRREGDHRRLARLRAAAERIATFDNDGTLWVEQPMYFQLPLRARPREGARAAASGVEGQGAVQHRCSRVTSKARSPVASGRSPRSCMATHTGMTTDEFEQDRRRLDRDGQAPAVQAAVHRAGLPADAGSARVSAGQRLQDVHRLRRRDRVHAPVDREGLWHSARAGRRQHDQDEVRNARRQARAGAAAGSRTSSTTRPASRSASTSTSAGGRSPPSATPTAIGKCSSGPRPATARG